MATDKIKCLDPEFNMRIALEATRLLTTIKRGLMNAPRLVIMWHDTSDLFKFTNPKKKKIDLKMMELENQGFRSLQ